MRWSREPLILIQSIIFPAFLLLVFDLVLGRTLTASAGQDSIYGQTALVALCGAMFGALSTGLALIEERDSGILSRFWALPVHRASGIGARLIAEVCRVFAGTVVLTLVGMALGLRFEHGALGFVGFILVPALFTIGFAVLVLAIAARGTGRAVLDSISIVCLLLLFFNSGFAPTNHYPGWLQPVVSAQPMSPAISTMRGLADGGAIAAPMLQTLAWTFALVGVFGWFAVRGYRRAAAE
ncbi:hypothetical protein FGL95_09540 [Nocardiaceae bacterium YC2-7]|uniref:Transport permease protein n=2 Tax=Antrihabitans stalactiti TaxID=2584121 RepID=A0A848K8Y5_9NOCA|nr:ABC transporter permease [Antrihabitans stalactiti]NMN95273.1 hypothetical protein [Antrihabitans stalactiti]